MATFKLGLLLIMLVLMDRGVIQSSAQCYNFGGNDFNGWTNDGFTSSGVQPPSDTDTLPGWNPPSGYAYVQDTSTLGKTGYLRLDNVEINQRDSISASLYRHVLNYDGTDRINVSFTSEETVRLLFNPNYDNWTPIQSITCGIGYVHCCQSYPCYGTLEIYGIVLEEDELVAIDFIGINSNCTEPPPPTTPEPTEEPTPAPTEKPTPEPTPAPTEKPTPEPTPAPTEKSTPEPTEKTTPEPTEKTTPEPTEKPTPEPTPAPTENPTPEPTPAPTENPTPEPTPAPTEKPTPEPTPAPTEKPTPEPTPAPTEKPTPEPTEKTTTEPTEKPTPEPTEKTTPAPTEKPTPEPTEKTTPAPTEKPTPEPTEKTTTEPTEKPTPEPTEKTTPAPTEKPTPEPTEKTTPAPTEKPTPEPTEKPTPAPTENPTPEPTKKPTPEPTEKPTPEPTEKPTPAPTAPSTLAPTTPDSPPAGYCDCTFNFDTCDWSIEENSNGWHWSVYKHPDLAPPYINGDEYIWIEDASGIVSSPTIIGANANSEFAIEYYFMASSSSVRSYVYFNGVRIAELSQSHPYSHITTIQCGSDCCDGAASCDGKFSIGLENVPGEQGEVAVSQFEVTGSQECYPNLILLQ